VEIGKPENQSSGLKVAADLRAADGTTAGLEEFLSFRYYRAPVFLISGIFIHGFFMGS
jgi:hypothetical protein